MMRIRLPHVQQSSHLSFVTSSIFFLNGLAARFSVAYRFRGRFQDASRPRLPMKSLMVKLAENQKRFGLLRLPLVMLLSND
jgi:hypothetical protein